MASGDIVGKILHVNTPSASTAAALTGKLGGSTPPELVPAFAFDDSSTEYLDLHVALRGYTGEGLTVRIGWSGAAASGDVRWGAAVRAFAADGEDLDSAHTYDFNDASDVTAPSAINEVKYTEITFLDGVDMDSWADGEFGVVRIRRTAATSNMSGDAYIWSNYILIRET